LWDLGTMQELHHWSAGSSWVTAVAYSLDGQILISGSGDGSLLLWNMNGEQTGQLFGHTGSIADLAIVPASGYLLSGSADGSMILWDLKTGKDVQIFKATARPITAIAVAIDNITAVSALKDGSLMLWDLTSAQVIRSFADLGADIEAVAITPDGSQIIYTTSAAQNHGIRMIDSQTGRRLNEKDIGCAPGDMVLSPDLSYVFTTCTAGVMLIDLKSWNISAIFQEASMIMNAVAISPDGRLGLTGQREGNLRVWNLTTPPVYHDIDISVDILTAIAIKQDGRYLLLNDASLDGSENPALWELATGEVVQTYAGFGGDVSPGAVAISPDSRFVAAAGFKEITMEPIVKVWDLDSGELLCDLKGFTENGRAVAFSPDSAYLLAGSQVYEGIIGHLILYDVHTCDIERRFETDEEVSSIQFSRDGTRAITGSSFLGRVILWDVATGKEIKRFSYADTGLMLGAAFGPEDTTVLSTASGEIYLWDVETAKLMHSYTGINATPWTVAISPDDKYVLSGSVDGDVILWDFSTREQLDKLNIKNVVFSIAFSPDSKTAYAGSMLGKLIEWPINVKSTDDLLDWIKENRYVREFTEAEKIQYNVEP
jgi:WD40 repeat protein